MLPFVEVDRKRVHDVVLYHFVFFIRQYLSSDLNYDGQEIIPKNRYIPLEYYGRKYDISFKFKDHIVFIEIKTKKLQSP